MTMFPLKKVFKINSSNDNFSQLAWLHRFAETRPMLRLVFDNVSRKPRGAQRHPESSGCKAEDLELTFKPPEYCVELC